MAPHTTATTKSIDVGSMFLLDLSLHESELNGNQEDPITENYHANQALSMSSNLSIAYHRGEARVMNDHCDYLSNSLDRLASAIDIDNNSPKHRATVTATHPRPVGLVTIIEPQPMAEAMVELNQLSSLSDESFIASSGGSLSASYSASSDEDVEKGSTTTREDSGVLDMKDLDGQLNNSYNEDEHGGAKELCQRGQSETHQQEKPISHNITATNLINKSANYTNINYVDKTDQQPNWSSKKPTNSNSSHHYHNHNHHNHHHHQNNHQSLRGQYKRSMSTSLPIQVPTRQMKKDLNKLKLNLINQEYSETNETIISAEVTNNHGKKQLPIANRFHDNQTTIKIANTTTQDDVDDFLEQEYNQNHHNHYPIDEYDEENLRAEENPMKLFESIQALARSLHEDAELFGSLPPKRMLESPIRSLALV